MVPGRSFEGLFTDSNIAYRAPDKSPTTLYASLRNSISVTGWPAWRTLSLDYESKPYVRDFTLTMNSGTRGYRPDQINAQSKFSEAATLINEIKNTIRLTDERVPGLYAQFTSESMAMVVFGSNAQELAGLGRGQTYKLCMRIFNGEEVDPAHIEERSEDYAASALFLRSQRGLEKPDIDDVVRSRREVIQHAQALKFITDTALNRDRPLTETLIKETHRTLCGGLPHPNGGPTEWAGQYRDVSVCAGTTQFCPPEEVPSRMATFVESFNDDVRDREASGNLDPFYLAADVCQDLVMIHPFRDGNGRMCRLLLNAYLIKYAGVVAPIGETDEGRKEYLGLARKAGDPDTEEEARGNLARFVLEIAARQLRRLGETIRNVLDAKPVFVLLVHDRAARLQNALSQPILSSKSNDLVTEWDEMDLHGQGSDHDNKINHLVQKIKQRRDSMKEVPSPSSSSSKKRKSDKSKGVAPRPKRAKKSKGEEPAKALGNWWGGIRAKEEGKGTENESEGDFENEDESKE